MRGQGSQALAHPLAGKVPAENAGQPAPAIGTGNEAAAGFVLIPYPVSANRYWRNFKGRMVVSKEAIQYKTGLAKLFLSVEQHKYICPVSVSMRVHPRLTKKGVASKVRADLDNLMKVIFDGLNGVAWVDDSQVVRILAEFSDPLPDGGVSIKVEAI